MLFIKSFSAICSGKCRKTAISFIFLFFIPLFCLKVFGQELKTGDLIFQFEKTEGSDFSKAITDATATLDSLKIVHVGIIEQIDQNYFVIEASPEEGVREIELSSFLESSPVINGQPAVIVKRLEIDFPVETTIRNARKLLGRNYDWTFLPDNEDIYCSELVYMSYTDSEGNHIFNSQPMNFRASDGSMPEFWTDLFSKLNMEVPEGLPGTNPNDLSKDSRLFTLPSPLFPVK